MSKRTLLGSALVALSLVAPAAAAQAAPARTVSPMVVCSTAGLTSVSRATILARGASWVTAKVPYSQTTCHTDANGTYRTDCSGFVSMAWGLPGSYVTSTLPGVATLINKADLQPGDILDLPSTHTVLFTGWYDAAHTRVNLYSEGSTATGTHASTGVPLSYYASYGAYRYNHVSG